MTGRATELKLFSQTTARLRAAQKSGRFAEIAEALFQNRRVWTHLAAEVADSANELPSTLRAQIFYLAEFTEHHTRAVLKGEADVAALLDINTAVMRGLSGNSGAAPDAASQPQPADRGRETVR
ncbi:flagellar biosynthesis regulator FlaF [Pseudoroseicyclus sp. CLL3-39]|uniref:Flagellar biosynthesis regulator FlaF n=2 Tax=Pseudoroseicyclus tamaricis TaxID=2705421 RepID=A0A6B2JLU5_9RHOB|nr:flagellar biosynthesis regulator FlaF [Pseudoroseicyclus tamaricis]